MRTLSILVFLSLLISCEPKNTESVEMIKIGSLCDYHTLVTRNLSMEFVPFQPLYADSLDLNSDNIFELKFINTAVPMSTGFAIITLIETTNNLQIALSKSNNFPDSLALNTILDNNSNWSAAESASYELQSYDCNQYNCKPVGNFIGITDKFIGFKLGSKYGWIKIDTSILGELRIKEFTLIK